MIKKICVLFLFIASAPLYLASAANGAEPKELTINYAAQNFKGPPKFKVLAYNEDSSRSVWSSKTITAEGGVDTERYGGNMSLKWESLKFQIPSNLSIDYFRIRFTNDECCGPKKGGQVYGDRNFYVKWLNFEGKRYSASRGKQKTCSSGKHTPGKMFCAGTLDIKVAKSEKSEPSVSQPTVASANRKKTLCGYKFDESQSRSDMIAVQKGLAKRKLYTGGIDGVFGSGSCKAFNKWAEC